MAQLLFPVQAEGSLIYGNGRRTVIGSELMAQRFASDRYFHPRPSAVDYKADAAGGSNLGTNNPDLRKAIAERAHGAQGHARISPAPVDLVTASGSGLDPDISPEAAVFQAPRVAAGSRAVASRRVRALIERMTESVGSDHRRPAAGQRAAAQPGSRQGQASSHSSVQSSDREACPCRRRNSIARPPSSS